MFVNLYSRSARPRTTTPRRGHHPTFRPGLEVLERRVALSGGLRVPAGLHSHDAAEAAETRVEVSPVTPAAEVRGGSGGGLFLSGPGYPLAPAGGPTLTGQLTNQSPTKVVDT